MGENINVLAENVLTVNLSSTVKDTTSENEALQLDICVYKERKWHDVLITKSYVSGGGANNIINDCTQQGTHFLKIKKYFWNLRNYTLYSLTNL